MTQIFRSVASTDLNGITSAGWGAQWALDLPPTPGLPALSRLLGNYVFCCNDLAGTQPTFHIYLTSRCFEREFAQGGWGRARTPAHIGSISGSLWGLPCFPEGVHVSELTT